MLKVQDVNIITKVFAWLVGWLKWLVCTGGLRVLCLPAEFTQVWPAGQFCLKFTKVSDDIGSGARAQGSGWPVTPPLFLKALLQSSRHPRAMFKD